MTTEPKPGQSGLTRRLGRELLLQAIYISLAVVIGVFAVSKLIEDGLIRQALEGEAEYYWSQEQLSPGKPLPDTQNMTGYREGFGEGVPEHLADLPTGYHNHDEPRETLTYVSQRGDDRLFLVFEVEQVDDLVVLFGIIPLAVVLIVIYFSIYSAYRVSRRAVSPVVQLAEQVQQLDPANPDASQVGIELGPKTEDEIRTLSVALQDLVERVSEFADRERRFTRDASHELRTPLTVIKIGVDRLMSRDSLTREERETLLRIRKSATDMEQLTTAFLLLARESGNGLDRDWVCVNEIVAAELDRAQIINPNSDITVKVSALHRLLVPAPEKVLESVVGNLLRNALAYTDAGSVSVTIGESAVVIEDTGPGMEPGAVKEATRPMSRDRRQRGGFGVGLTIVKRLTDRFGWPVTVESESSRGTTVEVQFPGSRTEPLSIQ